MKRLRVAHVITRLCQGGAQENTLNTVLLHDRARYEPELITGVVEPGEASIEFKAEEAGVTVLRIPDLMRAVAPLHDWRALRELTRLFRERRYDIVHTHTSKAGYVGRLAAARAGVPVVVHTPHGHVFDGYFSKPVTRLFIALERHAARKTDRIIALTPRGIEEHLAEGIGRREQYAAIFSGIDLRPFAHHDALRAGTRTAAGYTDADFIVGCAGRLEPVKGFSLAIEAARRVCAECSNVRFLLAGAGPLEPELRAMAAPLGDRFQFVGFQHDVARFMAGLDLFVLPSLNEGMGRVLLECGAAGVAAVATRVGGVPDIVVDGETGLLVPPRAPDALAAAILTLVRDPARARRMGQAARARIVPAYGIEEMVRKIQALYEDVVALKIEAGNAGNQSL